MQREVEKSPKTAEARLIRQPFPQPTDICTWVLDLVETSDEKVTTEAYGALFPNNPTVTVALTAQTASQLRELAGYVLKQTQDLKLRHRADALFTYAGHLIDLS
jgi:hypothetical protein